MQSSRPAFGPLIFFSLAFCVSLYFTFAAVQGDFGLFRRAEIENDAQTLALELANLQAEVTRMENLTRRLSDTWLDLDLLDQQTRDVLGMIRPDEIIVN